MTTADGPDRADPWTAAVRRRLGLGRLLPLGGPEDGAWIAERAAAAVLRSATADTGAFLEELRLAWAGSGDSPVSGLPGPPGALPPGPLRIEGAFAATARRPLPQTAGALRAALLTAAAGRLGLTVREVDLRVTDLLDEEPARRAEGPDTVRAAEPEGAAGAAAVRVPGVVALTRVLGSAVHTGADHVRVELATARDRRALDVARSVRAAVAGALEDGTAVTVLVTAVVDPA
ncbi:hypothetical protein [Streptomyces nitrosporeus]|uniref:Nucleopolyhedrovirus P10 family protein n=1 Tax=Streptomyces nitrosporeus TaxID=28894 RepID=A0A5J6FJR5_9ACTN|nr:hypothetical protein [Streptomyces nitrosporeus]QEU75160.1 hypothetical protein CP967_27125 [Streptomyces nitrosporeus]GGY90276.1 hypothetical protein GCM10010327_21240 [Streptomyces nitrosporeus]